MASENATPNLRKGKTIEQIYQKKTPLEHILLRPDTYVGSTEHSNQEMYVFEGGQMVWRSIEYVPALYKIFDEIIVNAADNMMRDKTMDTIDVVINKSEGFISVKNNGKGVPVQMHKEQKVYVPEMIFGQLLTSDNYNDDEKKVTGGRNGYGAKLTNVFSKKFIVETADKLVKKQFHQVFENNMQKKNAPKITDFPPGGKEFTKITFWPDFAKFGMKGLDDDIIALMSKRVYDVAGTTAKRCKVTLNGNSVPITTFEDYVQFHCRNHEYPAEYEKCGDRWEVAVSLSEDGSFTQCSFVNSICTIKGGTHVQHVTDQLVEAIAKKVKAGNKGGIEIKPAHIKNHLWVFVNACIENPAFDSQTKETLTTKQSKFGSTCEISEALMKKVLKSGIVETILEWARQKQKVDIAKHLKGATKNTVRVLGIPKLEDANDAGTKNSSDCTLILTEGDSAKSLAVAGLSIVGRDKFGVFPLKGKLLNVRDANFKQVTQNQEIQNLLKIMGLDLKCEYDNTKKLRYGSIMMMTDQDHDGSHIKGLLINMVHHWWPSLAQMDGFLKEFVTPIVKVWKEGKKEGERKEERCFFTLNEFHMWQNRTNGGKGWKTKYYKGLGTSTSKEAKEYFKDIENHELRFRWASERDGQAIDLAFNKKRADDRKEWINAYEEGTFVDHSKPTIGYQDFIYKELVQYAKYDVSRSIPSLVDGFKPSQRKVLFCSFKKKLKHDIKVAQFVGYISEHSAYHHGETSLENTIVNLAQTFCGSNNANLLVPSGQFGTRLQGGKDHAAARYIYTRLSPATRLLFPPDDDPVLDYLEEEGQPIEPSWYCPIIPTALMNGADGIGVGWSTFIPNYNPRDLIDNVRKMLRGKKMEDILPWYKGFSGSISAIQGEEGRFEVCGVVTKKDDKTVEITEIPIRKWTQDYKEFLEGMMPGEKKSEESDGHMIEDFREYHTENSVHFVVTLTAEKMREAEKVGLEKIFKLKTTVSIQNMMLFDQTGKIAKYESALDILTEFCKVRRGIYEKRKAFMVAKLTKDKEILSNKARFILMVVNEELELRKKKKEMLLKELVKLKFAPMSELNAIMKGLDKRKVEKKKKDPDGDEAAEDGAAEEASAEKTDYDYLLGMNLWSLTFEKVDEIKKQLKIKEDELKELKKKSVETFWDEDLNALSACFDELDLQDDKDLEAAKGAAEDRRRKVAGSRGRAPAPAVVVKRKATRDENKLLSAPLVDNAGSDLGTVKKSVSGSGEDGPTRFSAADIPLEDQQTVSRDPDVIQRPAKAARVRRAPTSQQDKPAGEESGSPEPAPAPEEGGSLLARLLASKKSPSLLAEPSKSGSHGSLSTGSDFFFGSSSSIFGSTSLPEPEPSGGTDPTGEDGPAAKKPKKGGKKKKGGDDDESDA
jgi:DNA topoisomerase-2